MHTALPLRLVLGQPDCFTEGNLHEHWRCCGVGIPGFDESKCWTPEEFHERYRRCCEVRVEQSSRSLSQERSSSFWGGSVPVRHRSLALWLRMSFWGLVDSTCSQDCETQLSAALMEFFALNVRREKIEKQRGLSKSSVRLSNRSHLQRNASAVAEVRTLESTLALLCWEALQLRRVALRTTGTPWEIAKAMQIAFHRVWEPLLFLPWMTILTLRWPIFSLLWSLYELWRSRPDSAAMTEAHWAHGLRKDQSAGILSRVGMKLYRLWEMRDDAGGALQPETQGEIFPLVRDVQTLLVRHARNKAGDVFHPLTLEVGFHPVGLDEVAGKNRQFKGYKDTGWPALRLLHGIHWQFVSNGADFVAEALLTARRSLPSRNMNGFPIVLDAGAHVGADSVTFSDRWPNGLIHSVEPNVAVYHTLRSNVKNISNIRVHHAALAGETNMKMRLYTPRHSELSSPETAAAATLLRPLQAHQRILPMHESPTESVRAFSLSDFAESLGLRHIDFLHLDLQGSEFAVLSPHHASELLSKVLLLQVEVMDSASNFWEGVPDGSKLLIMLHKKGFVPIARTPQLRNEDYCDVILMNRVVAPSSLLQ